MTILTLQPDGTTGQDSHMDSSTSSTNYATATEMVVGERDDLLSVIGRSLIRFDLSVIPKTARIISAQLTLTISFERSSNARDQKIYRVLRNWVAAEVSWLEWSSGNSWTAAGCTSGVSDYDSTVWATLNLGTSESGAKTWNLSTAEFTKIVNGTYPNYGWLIAADTQLNDAIAYCTSNHATASNRPKLVVEYATSGASPMISPSMRM